MDKNRGRQPFVEKAESTVGEPQEPPVLKSRAGMPKCGAPKAWAGFLKMRGFSKERTLNQSFRC